MRPNTEEAEVVNKLLFFNAKFVRQQVLEYYDSVKTCDCILKLQPRPDDEFDRHIREQLPSYENGGEEAEVRGFPIFDLKKHVSQNQSKIYKEFSSLQKFRNCLSTFCGLDFILRNSLYNDPSLSGKAILNIALLRRVQLLYKRKMKTRKDFNVQLMIPSYELFLRDLLYIENQGMFNFAQVDRHEVYYYKTICLLKLKRYEEAEISCQKSMELLDKSLNFYEKRREKLETSMKLAMLKLDDQKPEEPTNIPGPEDFFPRDSYSQSPHLSELAKLENYKKITKENVKLAQKDLRSNPDREEGVFAAKDVEPFEILALEEPYATAPPRIEKDKCQRNAICHNCLGDTNQMAIPPKNNLSDFRISIFLNIQKF